MMPNCKGPISIRFRYFTGAVQPNLVSPPKKVQMGIYTISDIFTTRGNDAKRTNKGNYLQRSRGAIQDIPSKNLVFVDDFAWCHICNTDDADYNGRKYYFEIKKFC